MIIRFLLVSFLFISFTTIAQTGFKKKQVEVPEGVEPERINASTNTQDSPLRLINTYNFDPTTPEIIKNEEAVIFAKNKQFALNSKMARSGSKPSSLDFVKSLQTELNIKNPSEEFTLLSEEKDEYGIIHARLQQKINGVNIYGGETLVHSNQEGHFETLNGKIFKTPNIDTKAYLTSENAIAKSLQDLAAKSIIQSNNSLLKSNVNQAELMVMYINQNPRLIYYVTVKPNILERWVLFIDANTGEVLDKFNHTCTLDGTITASAKDLNGINKTFNVVQKGSNYFMIDINKKMYNASNSALPDNPIGSIWTIDGLNSKSNDNNMNFAHVSSTSLNTWSDKAVSAHANASFCYDYYLSNFSRNSLNGSGGNIISVINIADEDGNGMDNAYWNGEFMGYGNGNKYFKPLAGALDVAGHEMTHGVIENTAKLEYRNQSGALNESFADIFGTLIERQNWLIGEQVVKPGIFPGGALRSMENPNQTGTKDPGYQPKLMSQYKYLADTDAGDNGGVHINSGIPNYAFYRFATGTGMDKNKAEKVYYQVLTKYLTRTSQFVDLRLAVIQASKDIYGNGSEAAAAAAAFDAVGILDPNASTSGGGGGTTTTPPTTTDNTSSVLIVNPGTENLVIFDPTTNAESLYSIPVKRNLANNEIITLADNKGCLGKPSVTDDGSFVYFVENDFNIWRINLAKNTSEKLTTDAQWRNVAVSKNGKLLAALKSHTATGKVVYNSNIYLFDLVKNTSTTIPLYNPTYSTGVSTGEILYADSFEWDYSGENIIYDAYNQLKGVSSTINYWDVGIVKVYDAINNTFLSKGVVQKVFSNLKRGENIGNPSISKTNTNIIAFDYYRPEQTVDKQFRIYIIDFNKSQIKDSIANNDVGYPNFSKSDDLLWFNGQSSAAKPDVKAYGLKSQAITSVGTVSEMYVDAKWATPYAIGTRVLPSKQAQSITVSPIADQNAQAIIQISAKSNVNLPLNYSLISGDASINGNTLTLGTVPGKITISVVQLGNSQYGSATAELSFCLMPPKASLTENATSVVASGGTSYQFYVNNKPVGGVTNNNTLSKDFEGTYSVKIATADGCYGPISNVISVTPLGTEPADNQLSIFPNPAENTFKFTIPKSENLKTFKLYNLKGQLSLEGNTNTVNVSNLSTGTYVIKVETDKGNYSNKVIKK